MFGLLTTVVEVTVTVLVTVRVTTGLLLDDRVAKTDCSCDEHDHDVTLLLRDTSELVAAILAKLLLLAAMAFSSIIKKKNLGNTIILLLHCMIHH